MYDELGKNFIAAAICGYIFVWFSLLSPGIREKMKENKILTVGVIVIIYLFTIIGIVLCNI